MVSGGSNRSPIRHANFGMYAVAAAIVVVGALWVGALWVGVPVGTLAVVALVLMCPLMMLFMMAGMHGMGGRDRGPDDRDGDRSHDHSGRGTSDRS